MNSGRMCFSKNSMPAWSGAAGAAATAAGTSASASNNAGQQNLNVLVVLKGNVIRTGTKDKPDQTLVSRAGKNDEAQRVFLQAELRAGRTR